MSGAIGENLTRGFIDRIKAEKPKTRKEANRLWLKYKEESDERFEGANPESCNVCGKKLVDLSKVFLGLSARVCDEHGIRPILVGQAIKATDFFRERDDTIK